MESGVVGGFDAEAVFARFVALDPARATIGELAWGQAAGDRLRSLIDAHQARIIFERTLPRPLDLDASSATGRGPAGAGQPGESRESDERCGYSDGDLAGSAGPVGPSPLGDGHLDHPTGGPGPERGAADLPGLGDFGSRPTTSWREEERLRRRAETLALIPTFATALAAGRIGTAHVDLLATVLTRVDTALRERVAAHHDELLAAASRGSPDYLARVARRVIDELSAQHGLDRLERQRRDTVLRDWRDPDTGMHHFHLQVDAERAEHVSAALAAAIQTRYRGGDAQGLTDRQVAAEAFIELCTGTAGPAIPGSVGPGSAHVTVLVDLHTLLSGLHDLSVLESGSGHRIHLETARRWWCDSDTAWAATIDGKVVSLVSDADLATRAQRRALRAMYRTCAFPACEVPFDRCHIHHVVFRHRGGATTLANLVPLCFRHHHAAHEGGWQLTIDPDRTLHWQPPRGGPIRDSPHVPLAHLDRQHQTPGPGPAPPAETEHPTPLTLFGCSDADAPDAA